MNKKFYIFIFCIIILSYTSLTSAEALRATPTKAEMEAMKAEEAKQAAVEEALAEGTDNLPLTTEFALPSEDVVVLQKALNDAGFLCQQSGLVGKKTVRALRRYQAANSLQITGKIDKQTLQSLGIYYSVTKKKKK